jgi:L-fuculose-phosphate aldolase
MANSIVDIEAVVRRLLKEHTEEIRNLEENSRSAAQKLHWSPEAKAIKREIVRVGKKLWDRAYVDGNGGNISARISEEYVVCTPTLLSKADLTEDDLCLIDLTGRQRIGYRAQTSETALHLEIYRSNPRARAIVHCHPPHATAYAIAGMTPPLGYIPEYEVIVGPVALARYETPGSKAFAQSVVPFIQDHSTILLENHGVVCWADTVTHAEWCVEVLDNYCHTLLIANQLGTPLKRIPDAKLAELLKIKQRLGLPDPRLARTTTTEAPRYAESADNDFEALVKTIAEEVLASLQSNK